MKNSSRRPLRLLWMIVLVFGLLWSMMGWSRTPRAGVVKGVARKIEALSVAEALPQHPAVRDARRLGYLTILHRERALSENVPSYIAWAIADAPGAQRAVTFMVAPSLTRALRARHSIGPSGSALNQSLKVSVLTAREAFVLGWLRALSVRDRASILRHNSLLNQAGPMELLEQAVRLAPGEQTYALALAALRAIVGPQKGKAACQAWLAAQTQARTAGKATVGIAIAGGVLGGLRSLSKACTRRQRGALGAIKLPAPPPEGAPDVGDDAPLSAILAADLRDDVAFVVLAPFFKGYMQVPEIRDIVSFSRLKSSTLVALLSRDRTGDLAIAALNAAILTKRLSPRDAPMVVWRATGGRHRSARQHARSLRLDMLSGAECMIFGYAKAVAGAGLVGKERREKIPAMRATPRQLFERGRTLLPSSAALGPLMARAHAVDIEARLKTCKPDKRAESMLFLVKRSSLPKAAAGAISEALQAVRDRCTVSRRRAKEASKGRAGVQGSRPRR